MLWQLREILEECQILSETEAAKTKEIGMMFSIERIGYSSSSIIEGEKFSLTVIDGDWDVFFHTHRDHSAGLQFSANDVEVILDNEYRYVILGHMQKLILLDLTSIITELQTVIDTYMEQFNEVTLRFLTLVFNDMAVPYHI